MELEPSLVKQLISEGILRHGHFVFRSGRHSNGLIDRDLLLADPAVASHFGYSIAKQFFAEHVETIATPSIWGAGLAQWVGYFLEPKAKVVDATPKQGSITIAEKLTPLISGRRVLLVDNLVISGETMGYFVDLVAELGGSVVGVAALWSSAGDEIGGRKLHSALNRHYPAYEPGACPLCAEGLGPPESISY